MHYDAAKPDRDARNSRSATVFIMNLNDPLVARAYAKSLDPNSELNKRKRKREWNQWDYCAGATTNFVVGKWWCTCNPKAIGGIWWQQVIDTRSKYKWFYNRTSRYVRPWKDGDELIRDGYVENGKVFRVRQRHLRIHLGDARQIAGRRTIKRVSVSPAGQSS
jgi:hypothetical protein